LHLSIIELLTERNKLESIVEVSVAHPHFDPVGELLLSLRKKAFGISAIWLNGDHRLKNACLLVLSTCSLNSAKVRQQDLLARTPKQWPQFRLPAAKASLTVLDVLNTAEQARNDMLRQWGKAVWRVWESEHTRVAAFVQECLHV
jgi:Family of unknown function (DUF5946)